MLGLSVRTFQGRLDREIVARRPTNADSLQLFAMVPWAREFTITDDHLNVRHFCL